MRRVILAAALLFAVAQGAEAPAGGLKVHVVQGMWSQHWRLPEALKEKYKITESFMCSQYGFATWLKGFPDKKADLISHQVLILANIPADSFATNAKGRSDSWIEEFLAQGGGVFVLGGNYSLGTGGNKGGKSFGDIKGTACERFLPADIHENDIVLEKQNKPVVLQASGKHPILEGVDWSKRPVTMFYHEVAPRAGAEVLVKAGEAPVLIAGTYQGGRIVLWTATLHGEPPEGDLAYWRWEDWPKLVRNIAAWVSEKKR
jgi:uncharacterized membrane protein